MAVDELCLAAFREKNAKSFNFCSASNAFKSTQRMRIYITRYSKMFCIIFCPSVCVTAASYRPIVHVKTEVESPVPLNVRAFLTANDRYCRSMK